MIVVFIPLVIVEVCRRGKAGWLGMVRDTWYRKEHAGRGRVKICPLSGNFKTCIIEALLGC